MSRLSVLTLLILLVAQTSFALVEVRAGYGVLASKPDLTGFYTGSSSDVPTAVPNVGLTVDALVTIPFVGLGVGARIENMNIDYDSDLLGVKNKLTRNSLILNYRLIDTLIYLGPILTYGITHTNGIKMSTNGSPIADISSNKVSSYSVGLEAGAKLLGLMVGAEVGTMAMKYKDATDSLQPAVVKDLDMSGTYAKIFIGFGI